MMAAVESSAGEPRAKAAKTVSKPRVTAKSMGVSKEEFARFKATYPRKHFKVR
jgi:hypothetical protein